MSKKGIVISTPYSESSFGGLHDMQEIRKYLLYWDEIDYPVVKNAVFELSDNLAFLQNSGVLKRTEVILQRPIAIDRDFFIAAQEQAFKKNEALEKGSWSLAQFTDSQYYTSTGEEVGIEFELTNCLPVPQVDVPFNDILEFKQKRNDELLRLRNYLDELYQDIIVKGDIPRAKNAALDKIELALKDIDKTMDESGITKIITNLKGTIAGDFTGIAGTGFTAWVGHSEIGFSSPLAAAAAGSAAMTGAAFLVKSMLTPKNTGSKNPLTYINSIKKDL